MPTVNVHIALAQRVTARCLRCSRTGDLDLVALSAAGYGHADLADLPLRCGGTLPDAGGPGMVSCGGRVFGFTVGARHTGPAR